MFDKTSDALNPRWHISEIGSGRVINALNDETGSAYTVSLSITPIAGYTNAQITDYDYQTWGFQWRPPLKLTVIAHTRASDQRLVGTAGFGFWNHPLSPDVRRLPRLPAAIWFFYGAPPTDLQFALGILGHGWKAAVIDAAHARAVCLAPFAPALMMAMRVPRLYPHIYRRVQRLLRISEAALPDHLLFERHTYEIEWRTDGARFLVDDQIVHESPYAPTGALGFIAWIDNQYMVATPQGRFRWGVTSLEGEQSLMIESVHILKKG